MSDKSFPAIRHALFRQYGVFPNTSRCHRTQLTADGAMQMLSLGQFMKSRYKNLTSATEDNKINRLRILVRSTKYPRTFQSAMALVFGFSGRRGLTTSTIETIQSVYFCSKTSNLTCICPAAVQKANSSSLVSMFPVDRERFRADVADIINVTADRVPWTGEVVEVSRFVKLCRQGYRVYVEKPSWKVKTWLDRDSYSYSYSVR